MTTLGGLPDNIFAQGNSINNAQQVVGASYNNDFTPRAFLWENGGPMVDLNDLVQPPSDIVVGFPYEIDDRGEIVAVATLPSGDASRSRAGA